MSFLKLYPRLFWYSIIPAMASGNTVILKHSAQTPLCAEQLYQSAKKTLPKDVFNYLHLNHEDSLKVVSDKRINFVSFTGSVKAGYDVQRATHTKFIDMALELGGKDPAYARHDCDLEKTVENLVDGSFFNSGQSCCGIERIYVDEKIYNNFIELFALKTHNYKLGNPLNKETNLGPVVKFSAADFIINQMNSAISKGAKKMIDDSKFDFPNEHKNYLVPQVDTDNEVKALIEFCDGLGVKASLCTHWANGGEGTKELADHVAELCEKNEAKFKFLYESKTPLFKKIETIAKEIYRADEVIADTKIRDQLKNFEEAGFGELPICVAKTQYSFSTDPSLKGAPTGHALPIREIRLSSGAEFIVVVCGAIMTMPGLPRVPAADSIKLNKDGEIEGLF